MVTIPKGKKKNPDPFVQNTLFWRRHAKGLFSVRESNEGKPVTFCKCYANAFTEKHC